MSAWAAIKAWGARAFAALGIAGVLAIAVGALFAAGEIREGFRAACSRESAGWMTRRACDLFDVVPNAPRSPVELPNTDEADRAETHVAGAGETAQGLTILDLQKKDLAALERTLKRDLDGDGVVGKVTPRAERPLEAFGAGELLFADKQVPRSRRGGRAVVTAPAAGGDVRVDFIPSPVPTFELLHRIQYRLSGELPVNGHQLGDELELSIDWTAARGGWFYFGAEPYVRRLPALDRQLLQKEFDWGVRGSISLDCNGLFRCRPE